MIADQIKAAVERSRDASFLMRNDQITYDQSEDIAAATTIIEAYVSLRQRLLSGEMREKVKKDRNELVGSFAPHWRLTSEVFEGKEMFTADEVRAEAWEIINALCEPDRIIALFREGGSA